VRLATSGWEGWLPGTGNLWGSHNTSKRAGDMDTGQGKLVTGEAASYQLWLMLTSLEGMGGHPLFLEIYLFPLKHLLHFPVIT
jgi:hypothetical protein